MTALHKRIIQLAFLSLLFLSSFTLADVSLPRLISNGAILQRDTANTIWGWAKHGEVVTVSLNGKAIGKTTAKSGRWSIKLKPKRASGPHTIEVSGQNTITINDVYFGDVWIASGQSNMQLPMERVKEKYPNEVDTANFPQIRMFLVPRKYDFDQPHEDVDEGEWQAVSPETIQSFSAVAYFFAKKTHRESQVAIGIVNSSYGGSPAEAWMSEEGLKEFPHYLEVINKYRTGTYLQDLIDSDKKQSDAWYGSIESKDLGLKESAKWFSNDYDSSSWKTIDMPNFWEDQGVPPMNGVVWLRKEVNLPSIANHKSGRLMLGRIVDADTVYVNGIKVGYTSYQYPPRRYSIEKNILKAGTNTITVRIVSNSGKGGLIKDKPYYLAVDGQTYDLKGPWQYNIGTTSPPLAAPKFSNYKQPLGFYNAMLAPLLKLSIKGVIWYQGESNTDRPEEYATLFPAMIRDWRKQWRRGDFPFIFVQLANYLETQKRPSESNWAETRNAQLKALNEPNTAMVVAIDVGEWNDIHPLDKKTVGERLALAAQKLAYKKNVVSSGPIFKSARSENGKIILDFDHTGSGLTYRGITLDGFAIASKTGRFLWANAKIEKSQIIVWHDDIQQPTKIRYAWADNPESANLYNKNGLPASPFEAVINPE